IASRGELRSMTWCRPAWPITSARTSSTRSDAPGWLLSRSPFHAGARRCGKASVKIGIIRSVTPLQLSRLIANAAADKKARGIVRIDIRQKSSIADYFVICEGDTDRQVRAITDSIVEACQAQGVRPLRTA